MSKQRFDWHSDPISTTTPITASYRNTQNARRFFISQCGDHFKFNRGFMKWLKDNPDKVMGDAVKKWLERRGDWPDSSQVSDDFMISREQPKDQLRDDLDN